MMLGVSQTDHGTSGLSSPSLFSHGRVRIGIEGSARSGSAARLFLRGVRFLVNGCPILGHSPPGGLRREGAVRFGTALHIAEGSVYMGGSGLGTGGRPGGGRVSLAGFGRGRSNMCDGWLTGRSKAAAEPAVVRPLDESCPATVGTTLVLLEPMWRRRAASSRTARECATIRPTRRH